MPRGRKSRLTPELIDAIAKRIRVGTYPYIAAAACGIPKSTYYRWMQTAERKGCRGIYKELRDKIEEAAAAARSNAEIRVFRDRPYEWLRTGPGKARQGEPGWTDESAMLVAQVSAPPRLSVEEELHRRDTLAGALEILESLDLIKRTEHGTALFHETCQLDDESSERSAPRTIDMK